MPVIVTTQRDSKLRKRTIRDRKRGKCNFTLKVAPALGPDPFIEEPTHGES